MNKENIPFQKKAAGISSENREYKDKVPWKLGRYVQPHHQEILDKVVKEYKQQMLKLFE